MRVIASGLSEPRKVRECFQRICVTRLCALSPPATGWLTCATAFTEEEVGLGVRFGATRR